MDDLFGEFADLVSFNQYIGWYDGLPEGTARISRSVKYRKSVLAWHRPRRFMRSSSLGSSFPQGAPLG
ncbi:MAG TPA: hypothetical protein VJ801_12930 [Polyangia bacterium]|nr:hypothetical protein [Polyangia bacterium]